jgi:cysteine desulfurase
VDPDALLGDIRPQTILLTVIHGNHEVGTLQPIEELIKIAHAHGVAVHVDAVQAVGRVEVDVAALELEFLSLSGHKFGGPKGVGALYINARSGATIQAVIHGGHQERERRAGTEDVPSIVAFGQACALMGQRLADECKRLMALRERLESKILGRIPDTHLLGDTAERLPNTSNISFVGIKGEALVFNLDLLGVAASTAASCSSRQGVPSQVLEAMGVSPQAREGSVRFSMGWGTTDEDIEHVLDVLPATVERLRMLSPLA